MDFNEKWKELEQRLTERFEKTPDLQAILYLIGINEFQGRIPKYKFSKQEKQDLIHVGTCVLLQQYDFFEFSHHDEDGWPHFTKKTPIHQMSLLEQEKILKMAILNYFEQQEFI